MNRCGPVECPVEDVLDGQPGDEWDCPVCGHNWAWVPDDELDGWWEP